jgi:hypothetical protein
MESLIYGNRNNHYGWVRIMPNCPKDGTEVKNPVKEWDLSPKSRKGPKLHIKLFECPTCGYRWRVVEKVG